MLSSLLLKIFRVSCKVPLIYLFFKEFEVNKITKTHKIDIKNLYKIIFFRSSSKINKRQKLMKDIKTDDLSPLIKIDILIIIEKNRK